MVNTSFPDNVTSLFFGLVEAMIKWGHFGHAGPSIR